MPAVALPVFNFPHVRIAGLYFPVKQKCQWGLPSRASRVYDAITGKDCDQRKGYHCKALSIFVQFLGFQVGSKLQEVLELVYRALVGFVLGLIDPSYVRSQGFGPGVLEGCLMP